MRRAARGIAVIRTVAVDRHRPGEVSRDMPIAALGEFLTIPIVLCLHIREELDKLWRLTDSIQKTIAGVARIQVISRDG